MIYPRWSFTRILRISSISRNGAFEEWSNEDKWPPTHWPKRMFSGILLSSRACTFVIMIRSDVDAKFKRTNENREFRSGTGAIVGLVIRVRLILHDPFFWPPSPLVTLFPLACCPVPATCEINQFNYVTFRTDRAIWQHLI